MDKICRQQERKLGTKQTCVELEKDPAEQNVRTCGSCEHLGHCTITTHACMQATQAFCTWYLTTHDVGCNVPEACKPDPHFGQLPSTVQEYC